MTIDIVIVNSLPLLLALSVFGVLAIVRIVRWVLDILP